MAKYYCILFDADNTLLNFDAAESKALAETLVEYGIEPDAETVQTYRTINEELWRQLEKGQIRRDKLMGERFPRFLKAIDAAAGWRSRASGTTLRTSLSLRSWTAKSPAAASLTPLFAHWAWRTGSTFWWWATASPATFRAA